MQSKCDRERRQTPCESRSRSANAVQVSCLRLLTTGEEARGGDLLCVTGKIVVTAADGGDIRKLQLLKERDLG